MKKYHLQQKNETLRSELDFKKQDLDNIKLELNDYKVTHEQYDLKIQFLNTEKPSKQNSIIC